MDHHEAEELIREGVATEDRAKRKGGTWADLGAGTGTFTRALARLLGREGTVYAVDKSKRAVRALRRLGSGDEARAAVRSLQGDFTRPLTLPALDGVLMANALHFAENQARVVRRVAGYLRPGGRLLLVEYDRTEPNPWVPYPVPLERFRALAEAASLTAPKEVGRRRSRYGREMYAALAERTRPANN
jgi:SAM-dependent methyltransferase